MAKAKASTPALKKFMQQYISVDGDGEYITNENAHKAMDAIFSEYENAYSGIETDKTGVKVFVVKSTKARTVFFTAIIR